MQKNRIEIAGVLAAKPELRFLPSGTKVANARLAEDYGYRDKDGKLITHTNWHSLAFYDEVAAIAATYEKGDNVFVEGTVEQRKFTPKDGSERTVHEVIVRSCHLIAQARSRKADQAETKAAFVASTEPRAVEGAANDDSWPVSAA
jgi:single-strand DNA-binding protein